MHSLADAFLQRKGLIVPRRESTLAGFAGQRRGTKRECCLVNSLEENPPFRGPGGFSCCIDNVKPCVTRVCDGQRKLVHTTVKSVRSGVQISENQCKRWQDAKPQSWMIKAADLPCSGGQATCENDYIREWQDALHRQDLDSGPEW
jgi:hypothetical protein